MGVIAGLQIAVRRILRVLARPVRRSSGHRGLVVECYRGIGSRHEFLVLGRVFRQPVDEHPAQGKGDLLASLQRLFRRGADGHRVVVRYADSEQTLTTDANGYFLMKLRLRTPASTRLQWHYVTVELEPGSEQATTTEAEVFVPPDSARLVVVSDIDDTVMFTGVASKLRMFWRLFAQGAHSRLAFPGVAALYRGLHGDDGNPIVYVSRAPWTIYYMLEAFFQQHRIPVGPVLFLRDWGVSLRRPVPHRASEHKLQQIRLILDLYRDLPVVLIGDSGQRDPETYARIVQEYPGRVRAIYIRNVSTKLHRAASIDALADGVLSAGTNLVLAEDTVAMVEHAVGQGLVAADTKAAVLDERRAP